MAADVVQKQLLLLQKHTSKYTMRLLACVVLVAALLCGQCWRFGAASVDHNEPTTTQENVQELARGDDDEFCMPTQVMGNVATGYLLSNAARCSSHAMTSAMRVNDAATLKLDAAIDRLLADSTGPDFKSAHGTLELANITLDMAKRAWQLLHERARTNIVQRVDLTLPAIDSILQAARVSAECRRAWHRTLEGAKRMESWAVSLLNSWGSFPPAGLFEGTYNSIGGYYTCMDVAHNEHIGHTHYCTITSRPVLPSRNNSYSPIVEKLPRELLHMFDVQQQAGSRGQRDIFALLLEHAQYHYVTYYKIGTCWPIDCTPFDVQRAARLVARRNFLSSGPVKCFSQNASDYTNVTDKLGPDPLKRLPTITAHWDTNEPVYVWRPRVRRAQYVAGALLAASAAFILLATIADILFLRGPRLWQQLCACWTMPNKDDEPQLPQFAAAQTATDTLVLCETNANDAAKSNEPAHAIQVESKHSFVARLIDASSLVTNFIGFAEVTSGQLRNDITCLHGLRCLTMLWILVTHTMLFNDWSQFARNRAVEDTLKSPIIQPLLNGTHLVDTFFIVSGLLGSFTTFKLCKNQAKNFKIITYLINRWTRLTPQILFVALIFIVWPLIGTGPHWITLLNNWSENCSQNWWISLLHMQTFYKPEDMCNFVSWWVAMDMIYHVAAIPLIIALLVLGHTVGLALIALCALALAAAHGLHHYAHAFPPSYLSTLPYNGLVWTQFTVKHFWLPFSHSTPYLAGFYIGYLMAARPRLIANSLNSRRALIGWIVLPPMFFSMQFATSWWVRAEASYTPLMSALYSTASAFVWTIALSWIIVCCQYGYAPLLNRLLSARVFVVLSRISYLVYLSHFQILYMYYGKQNVLLEPTTLNLACSILGIVVMSSVHGLLLHVAFELPWLSAQRWLMRTYFNK